MDICALEEIKERSKGPKHYDYYIVIYIAGGKRGKDQGRCGDSNPQEISEEHTGILNKLSVYSPERNKTKQEREYFYDQLQNSIDSIPSDQHMIILGDFNDHIDKEIVPRIRQKFNENIIND